MIVVCTSMFPQERNDDEFLFHHNQEETLIGELQLRYHDKLSHH